MRNIRSRLKFQKIRHMRKIFPEIRFLLEQIVKKRLPFYLVLLGKISICQHHGKMDFFFYNLLQ